MKLIALLKQVPDMETVRFDREKGLVDRSSAAAEINPFDLNALEAAVQIKEVHGGRVTAVSMGPESAEEALQEAIARGSDEGILLSDRQFGGSDTKATSFILSCAVRRLGAYDLILCGEKTIDGDTGQVGAEVAEYLDIPHACYVEQILELTDDSVTIRCKEFGGRYQKKLHLPALLAVTKDLNVPRLPSFRNKIKARSAVIERWDSADLSEFSGGQMIGGKSSPTQVKKIEVPEETKKKCCLYRNDIPGFLCSFSALVNDNNLGGGFHD